METGKITMVPVLGNILLFAALFGTLLPFLPKFPEYLYKKIQTGVMGCCLIAFGCLIFSYIMSDFSVLNVYQNSHLAKPLLYKITGTWGNHEGSMLLIILVMAGYNFAFANFGHIDEEQKNIVIKSQSLILAGFLVYIIFASNPFEIISPVPENGNGLNPLLQDVGLAMHPPVLYIGYVGFSIAFSFSIAGLLTGKADRNWAGILKKWVLFSWSFLTLGIGLGSWWAYRELGWGGFWFWDPVENVSFMPWLGATALLHSLVVMEKRQLLKIWVMFLCIITFSLSLIGIFLVRSGILTSVHSFASDPERGIFILAILSIVMLVSLTIFALKAHKLSSKSELGLLSKEGGILINNLFLAVACATVLIGTLYPVFLEMIAGADVWVGAPYFNSTFNVLVLPLIALAGIAPFIKWKKDNLQNIIKDQFIPFSAGIFTGGLIFILMEERHIIAIIAISLAVWLIVSIIKMLLGKIKSKNIPAGFYGMVFAHIGLGLLVIGVACASAWELEQEDILQLGEAKEIRGYKVELKNMFIAAENNYLLRRGEFHVYKDQKELAVLRPEVRFYPIEKTNTTEADIYYGILSNLYAAIGDTDGKGGFAVRIYHKPMINLIWAGCLFMTVGGFVSFMGRRKKNA